MRFSHGSHDLPAVYFSLGRPILKIHQHEDRQMTDKQTLKEAKARGEKKAEVEGGCYFLIARLDWNGGYKNAAVHQIWVFIPNK